MSDAQENRWIRRHVPGTLARIPTQRSLDILLGASADPDGFVRFKALAAVERLHRQHAHLLVNRETVERRLIEDVKKYHGVLTLRFNLGRHDQLSERSLLERAFDDKLRRIADRIFRLLALIQPWKEVEAARSALGHRKGPQGPLDGITNDRRAAVAAVEYFDNTVSHSLRKWLMPILDDMPMAERARIANTLLRTRPRDLEDTVAQLVHDDDRVISAAAIQFVWKRRWRWSTIWSTYEIAHIVSNSASWALDTWSSPDVPVLSLPIIEVVDRLRRIPLFERLSVDEMLRIANLGSQLTYSSGDTILNEGVTAERVVCLLDRPVSLATGQVYRELRAPAVLAFDEMLERQQLRETVIALDYAACLALRVDDFLAMISDDIQVVQGLRCSALLTNDITCLCIPLHARSRSPPPHRFAQAPREVIRPEQNPLLAGRTVNHLLDMAGIAREVTLERATTLFDETDVPAVFYVLSGTVRLERTDLHAIDARPGATIGMSAVLAGMPAGWRARVMEDGYALCLEREDLIDLLAEEVELLRYLASAILHAAPMTPMRESGSVKVA